MTVWSLTKKQLLWFPRKRTFTYILATNINLSSLDMTKCLIGQPLHVNANANGNSAVVSKDLLTLCKQGRFREALHIFHIIDYPRIQPNFHTYVSLLQACLSVRALPEGKLVHAHIVLTGFYPNSFLGTKLVIVYAKCGTLVDARRALDEMLEPNVVSWTAIIAAYSRHGFDKEALISFDEMQRTGTKPDQFTFATVLPACANLADVENGKEIHANIIKSGYQSEVFVGSSLVDMYIKCGRMDIARNAFDEMPKRNVVSWNAMIAGYTQNGDDEQSLTLFKQMQQAGIRPDEFTFASVLPSCATLAALELGKEIHEGIIKNGFQSDVFVGSALVNMYAKCGSIQYARQVFDKMPERNVVSWTAMIVGYAVHGCGKEAIQLFEQMHHSGMKPDHVTFVAVLSACCHAGLVDDGWQYFDRMSRDYHITPAMEHYCCMVDLLGRAGLLNEAQEFVKKMPLKPQAAIWETLLGASMKYKDIELGEYVAEHLFESDPENAAHYVVLSKIYAAAGRWDGVEKVQKMMKERRVKKWPGCSWIEPSILCQAILFETFEFMEGSRLSIMVAKAVISISVIESPIDAQQSSSEAHKVLQVSSDSWSSLLEFTADKEDVEFGILKDEEMMHIHVNNFPSEESTSTPKMPPTKTPPFYKNEGPEEDVISSNTPTG
eukprot:Gb_28759 [translate_table: standard]